MYFKGSVLNPEIISIGRVDWIIFLSCERILLTVW